MKKHINQRVLIGITLAAGTVLAIGVCNSSAVRPPVSRYQMTKFSDLHNPIKGTHYWAVKPYSGWASDPWTGDDAPYERIEREVDEALKNGGTVGNLLEQYSLQAQQKPTDPQAQFRWSYLAREVILAQPHRSDWELDSQEVISVLLARAVSPKTYSYDRLRFLEARQDPNVTELGERLLKRDPNDVSVKYALISDYSALFSKKSQKSHTVDPKLKQRAVALAQQLIHVDLSNPDYHVALAGVYVSSFEDHKNANDAAAAIAAYQDYFKLVPPDDFERKRRQIIVNELQLYLATNPVQKQ